MLEYTHPGKLKAHPANAKIYGDSADGALLGKIEKAGILTPLMVTKDGRIISGHRRWVCARLLEMQAVPIIVFESEDENDIVEAMIMANEQRERTTEQKAREYQKLKLIEAERAKARQGTRTDIQENFPGSSPGQARDHAAARIGLSGRTAEKASQVVDAIDQLEEAGDREKADEVRSRLNKSVNGAFNDVKAAERSGKEQKPKFEVEHISDQLAICRPTNPNYKSTFNFTNENINWAAWSWNPVTGCLHGCQYCYARSIANNEYYGEAFPTKFKPTFHPGRLEAPYDTKIPEDKKHIDGIRRVFVCSMADLFGDWVPDDWIKEIVSVCDDNPQFDFLFLTKNPKRYSEFYFSPNCWLGATADTQKRADEAVRVFKEIGDGVVRFLSCEPLMEEIRFGNTLEEVDLVIIGALKNSEKTDRQPRWKWVENIIVDACASSCRYVFKPNLTVRPEEYPASRMRRKK